MNINVSQDFANILMGVTPPAVNEDKTKDETKVIKESEEQEDLEPKLVEQEVHVCPLCESQLNGPIPEERLAEHIGIMAEIVDELRESQEETDEEETVEENEEESTEDETQKEEVKVAKNKAK